MKLRIVQRAGEKYPTVEDEDGNVVENVTGVEYRCSIDEPATIHLELLDTSPMEILGAPVKVLEGECDQLVIPDADEWMSNV